MAPAKGKSSRHRSHKEDDEDDSSDADTRKSGKHRDSERLHRPHSASEDEDFSSDDGAARKSSRKGKQKRISSKEDDQDAVSDEAPRKSAKHRDSDRRVDDECQRRKLSDKDERVHKREDDEDASSDGAARKSGKHRDSDKDERVHRENRKRKDSNKDERAHRRTDDESGKHRHSRGHRRDEDVSSDRETERTRRRSGRHSDDSSDGEHRKSSRVSTSSKHRDYDKDRGHKRRHSASEHHSSKKTKPEHPQSPSPLQVTDLGKDSSSKNDARNMTKTENENKNPLEDVEDPKDDRGRTRHNDSNNAVEKKREHKERHRNDKEERDNELKDEELRKSDKKHRQKDEHDNKFHSDSRNREDRRYDSDNDRGHYRREDSEYRSRNSRDHRDVKKVYEEDRREHYKDEDERKESRRRHYRDEDEDRYTRRSYRDEEYVHRSYRENHRISREEPQRREWSRDSREEKFDKDAEIEHGRRHKAPRESKDEKEDLDLQNGKEHQISSTKAGDENRVRSKSHSNDLYNEEDHRKGEKEQDPHERSVHRGTSSSRSSMRNEDGYGRKHGERYRRNEDIWSWSRAQGVYSPFGHPYGAGFPGASMYGAAQVGYFGYPWYTVPGSVLVEDPGQSQEFIHLEYPQTEEFQEVMEVENVPEEAGVHTDTGARAACFKAARFSGQMKQLVSRLSVSEELAGQETLEKYQKFLSDEQIQPPAVDNLSPFISDSEDSDLALEADSQAEELLRGADKSDRGSHVFPSNVFEDILKIYKKRGEENGHQKSVVGSDLLPDGIKAEQNVSVDTGEQKEACLENLATVAETSLVKEASLEEVDSGNLGEAYSENLGTTKEEGRDKQLVDVDNNFGDVLEEVKTDEEGVTGTF